MRLFRSALILAGGFLLSLSLYALMDRAWGADFMTGLGDREEAGQVARLDADFRELLRCREARHEVAARVAAGDRSLAEAVRDFAAIHANRPVYLARLRERNPSCSDEGVFAQDVRAEVSLLLEDQPERLAEVLARLDGERLDSSSVCPEGL
jgi:hypothetical protein